MLFLVVALFFGLDCRTPTSGRPRGAAVASFSFIGIGIMTAVLPLISPEKGAQLGFVAQGMLLVVSGVYYPVDVLPHWMEWLAAISPATYALDGVRAILDGDGLADMWDRIWPLTVLGAVAVQPGRTGVFSAGERYAKRNGKLKRSGLSRPARGRRIRR